MDRVDSRPAGWRKNNSRRLGRGSTQPSSSKAHSRTTRFADSLNTYSADLHRDVDAEEVEALAQEVRHLGERLTKERTYAALRAYRATIQRALRLATSRLTDIEHHESTRATLKRKRFLLIKVIDGKLNEIVESLVERERSPLLLMEKVGEIQGLLFNLLY